MLKQGIKKQVDKQFKMDTLYDWIAAEKFRMSEIKQVNISKKLWMDSWA